MQLNPFAREFVPFAAKQNSLLTASETVQGSQAEPASPAPASVAAQPTLQSIPSSRCPTPAARALEAEELQFEDVFEAGTAPSPPSPRSHLRQNSPGGVLLVRNGCTAAVQSSCSHMM